MTTLLWVVMASCWADYYVEYIWYRAEPDESRVVITWEHLRGSKAIDRFVQNKREHEAKGKFLAHDYGSEKKEFVREEQLGGHLIKTIITIHPHRGNSTEVASPDVDIVVYFDGIKRVDCPFGYIHRDSVTIPKIVIYSEDESAKASFRNEVDKLGREAMCFFDGKDEMITYEYGLLRLIPYEECGPREVNVGEAITVRGKLLSETFPDTPNYNSINEGDSPETDWILHVDVPIRIRGEGQETGESYSTALLDKLQLAMTAEQIASNKNMLGKQVKVYGEVFTGHSRHHKTSVLLDITKDGNIKPLGILPDE